MPMVMIMVIVTIEKKEVKYPEQVHHNAQFHYAAVRHILLHLKYKYKGQLKIKKLTFFTDGCTSQYKNRNNCSRMLQLAKDFKIDIIIHCFAGTACFKGSHDAYGGWIKQAIHKKQLSSDFSLYNAYDIIQALRQHPNLLGVNNPINPDNQCMMKVTGVELVLLVREDNIDQQYSTTNAMDKDAASKIRQAIANPDDFPVCPMGSAKMMKKHLMKTLRSWPL